MDSSARLVSLDAFRGATIAAMILVNNPGNRNHTYVPLLHAEWHGWTFTDIIFPSFLWIGGVALTLSFAKRVERGEDKRRLAIHTVRRAALLFLTGLLLNAFPHFSLSTLRIPGVLQRIAICYLIAALLYLYCPRRTRIATTCGLLAVYPALMALGPGWDMGNNFAATVDEMFLSGHMWSVTKTWDPEGIVSTLPAIATALLGIFAGETLRHYRSPHEAAASLFAAGVSLVVLGNVAGLWIPINKSLWTSSFALLMAGISTLGFAWCYWVIDIRQWRSWARSFVIYGSNAIGVYVLSGLLASVLGMWKLDGVSFKRRAWEALAGMGASPHNASLLYALANVLVLYLAAWLLWRKRWFLKF